MRKRHEVIVARDTEELIRAECIGKGCPLCASTVEQRAKIVFVKGR